METSPDKVEEEDTANYDFLSQITMQSDTDLRDYTEKVKTDLQSFEQSAINHMMTLNPQVATLYNELTQTDRILGMQIDI